MLVVVTIVALYGAAFANPIEDPAGKKIFVDAKCNACHTVTAVQIESKGKKPSDLSGIGANLKVDFMKQYLMKKEKANEKLHPVVFKGNEADLAKLVDWLSTLKKK